MCFQNQTPPLEEKPAEPQFLAAQETPRHLRTFSHSGKLTSNPKGGHSKGQQPMKGLFSDSMFFSWSISPHPMKPRTLHHALNSKSVRYMLTANHLNHPPRKASTQVPCGWLPLKPSTDQPQGLLPRPLCPEQSTVLPILLWFT